jgi:predicted phosphate transport protein (TIGR00153 family)
MTNSILSKLAPQETKFYPLLDDLAALICKVSDLMLENVADYKYEKSVEYFKLIKDVERAGDAITHTIFDALNTTFITPFDREDIHDLANALDDVIDYVNKSAKRIAIYHPHRIPETAATLTKLVKKGAEKVQEAVSKLERLHKEPKVILTDCNALHDVESEADDVYEKFTIDLFEHTADPIEIIKLKEIMHELEQATDAEEKIGKILKTIIVKYA